MNFQQSSFARHLFVTVLILSGCASDPPCNTGGLVPLGGTVVTLDKGEMYLRLEGTPGSQPGPMIGFSAGVKLSGNETRTVTVCVLEPFRRIVAQHPERFVITAEADGRLTIRLKEKFGE